MRRRTFACIACLGIGACTTVADLPGKDDPWAGREFASPSEVAGLEPAPSPCDTGATFLDFTRPDQEFGVVVDLPAGAGLRVETGGDPGLDTVLAVFGPRTGGTFGAKPLATSDDREGSGLSRIDGLVVAGGMYLLYVSTYEGRYRGTVTLRVWTDGQPGCGCAGCVNADVPDAAAGPDEGEAPDAGAEPGPDGGGLCIPAHHVACCGGGVCQYDSCGRWEDRVAFCPYGCKDAECIDCVPGCAGRSCGDDGCQGSCGTCDAGRVCLAGTCVAAPVCGGETCPSLGDLVVGCNAQDACEYRHQDASGWRHDDVRIWIPGGPVWIGANVDGAECPGNAQDGTADGSERPCHRVDVPGFWMDKYEVTVKAYRACEEAGACPTAPLVDSCGEPCNTGLPARDGHPANCLTWESAAAFCRWAGGRLCTEAEWEKGARGTDGRRYPWGDAAPGCQHAVFGGGELVDCTCNGGPCAAGSRPAGAGPYGTMDQAGNLWELVEDDWHGSYVGAPSTGAWVEIPRAPFRVGRGGAFQGAMDNVREMRASGRVSSAHVIGVDFDVGARCCRSGP